MRLRATPILLLLVSAAVADDVEAKIYCSTSAPQPVPTTGTGGFPCIAGPVTDVITVPGGDDVVIGDVNVSLYLTHTFDGDLEIDLISPDGTVIDLSSDNGGGGNDFGSTCGSPSLGTFPDSVFDDQAYSSILDVSSPFVGSWQPEEALSAFNGEDSAGDWTISICDDAGGDSGTFHCWCVEILEEPIMSVDGGIQAEYLIVGERPLSAAALESLAAASSVDLEGADDGEEAAKALAAEAERAQSGSTGAGELGMVSATRVTADPAALSSMLCDALDLRFVDRGEGTVLDCRTGLIWLKDASCLGTGYWDPARSRESAQGLVDALNAGGGQKLGCEDYEASYSDWRLPTMAELCGQWSGDACADGSCCSAESGLVDATFTEPALSNAGGDGPWSDERAFVRVRSESYWSADDSWAADLSDGSVSPMSQHTAAGVWPVRREPEKDSEEAGRQ